MTCEFQIRLNMSSSFCIRELSLVNSLEIRLARLRVLVADTGPGISAPMMFITPGTGPYAT
jgi:hypothetical protein